VSDQTAVERLVAYVPGDGYGGWPDVYETGVDPDRDAPFFSEAVLSPLLGKDDARSLLAIVRRVAEEAGVEMDE
jgi:hypothetical protein